MSDSPRPPNQQIAAIIDSAAAGENAGGSADVPPAVADLAERLDLLVADFGRWTEYKAASVEYIREFTAEVRWHRRTRASVVIGSGVLVLALAALLVVTLCLAQRIFSEEQAHSLTALIVGSISGIVIITIAALRGAFATVKDRNEGLPMPEHVKQMVEVGQSLFGKS